MLVGTIAWALALVLSLVFRAPLVDAGLDWITAASATGVVLGVIGLVVVQLSRRRARQTAGGSTG